MRPEGKDDLIIQTIEFNRRGDEWSLRAFASMPSTAIFLRARAEKKFALRAASSLESATRE